MYRQVLLAYDGTKEGRTALREGAVLARRCDSKVFLLSVAPQTMGIQLAEATLPGVSAQEMASYRGVLDEGVERLRRLGFQPSSELIYGDPVEVISRMAKKIHADLVVVGHRRKSILERWWSGDTGASLLDHLDCSLLIARNLVDEADVAASMARSASRGS